MGKLRYLTKEGFRNLKVNKLMTIASITVLFSCLILVGVAYLLLVNIESKIEDMQAENVILVYADIPEQVYSSDDAFTQTGEDISKVDGVEGVTIATDDDGNQVYMVIVKDGEDGDAVAGAIRSVSNVTDVEVIKEEVETTEPAEEETTAATEETEPQTDENDDTETTEAETEPETEAEPQYKYTLKVFVDAGEENAVQLDADAEDYAERYDYYYGLLGGKIGEIEYVDTVEKVPKDKAYDEILAGYSDEMRNYLKGYDNPLPDGYKVTVSDMAHFDEVVNQIKLLDHVYSVNEKSDLAHQISTLRDAVRYISLGIIVLLLIVSLFIISNTIKVTMFSRRLEISIMKSVGATNSFIKWPFVVEGIIIGIISGGLALAAVWALNKYAIAPIMTSITLFGETSTVNFRDYAPVLALIFVFIGVFTGVFGSLTSIRKYLKERKFVELDD